MANPFRDMSVIMQALVAAAVAVVLVLVGVYVPGSPIARERDEVDRAVQQRTKLNQEVQQLSVYKQRYGELKQQMDALSKQLDTLKTIVPEEKEVDEFIHFLLFRHDRLQGVQLLGERVHLLFQFAIALLVDTELLDFLI